MGGLAYRTGETLNFYIKQDRREYPSRPYLFWKGGNII